MFGNVADQARHAPESVPGVALARCQAVASPFLSNHDIAAAQAAAKELRSAQRRATECRVHVRGEVPATAAAAAAAAQKLREEDGAGRPGTAPLVCFSLTHSGTAQRPRNASYLRRTLRAAPPALPF